MILHDLRADFSMRSPRSLFYKVLRHKSLLHAPVGKGLSISNLTSQFFANLYMNELDQYVKHVPDHIITASFLSMLVIRILVKFLGQFFYVCVLSFFVFTT